MGNFSEYLDSQADVRQPGDPVWTIATTWKGSDHGKIRSVSGVRKWFDEALADPDCPLQRDVVDAGLAKAVQEYTSQRDGQQTPATQVSEWQAWVTGVLEGFDQRLSGIEAALTWLVDSQAGQSAAQQAERDSRSVQDYRDWAGGDQTRSEAAALGLVTPAPGRVPALREQERSTLPGYEHVLPPTQIEMVGPEHVDYPLDQGGITQPDNSGPPQGGSALAQAMGLDADPALAAQREAIAAEAARIQASASNSPDTPPGAFYDESAQVQAVRPTPDGEQEWASGPQRTTSYSPEQWRAWAMTSDIPDEPPEQA